MRRFLAGDRAIEASLRLVKLVGVGANQSMVGGLLWQENRAVPCFMENYEALISVGLVSSIQGRSRYRLKSRSWPSKGKLSIPPNLPGLDKR